MNIALSKLHDENLQADKIKYIF